MTDVAVRSTLKRRIPAPARALLLNKIKDHILGKRYELSVAFVGEKRSHTLNKKYRKKDKPTNVLAFPLDKHAGEIVINVPLAMRESKRFGATAGKHITFLFIHGCLHLKGHAHGRTMESTEDRIRRHFGI